MSLPATNLRQTPYIDLYGTTIGLYEPDIEKAGLYRRQLATVSAIVVEPETIYQLPLLAKVHQPDAVVVNPFRDPAIGLDLVELMIERFPDMPVILIGEPGEDDYLDVIMSAGVRAHLHPKYSQPRDLLEQLSTVLS